MQSIDDIARAITELEPAERQALMDRLAQLDAQADSNGQSQSKIQAIEAAMNDELFLADLREVMEDFRHVDNSCSSKPSSAHPLQTLPKA